MGRFPFRSDLGFVNADVVVVAVTLFVLVVEVNE